MKRIRNKNFIISGRFLWILLFCVTAAEAQNKVSVHFGNESPEILFAAEELKNALEIQGYSFLLTNRNDADIVFSLVNSTAKKSDSDIVSEHAGYVLKSEGFVIRKDVSNKIQLLGVDEAGLMYGGLELAEQIRLRGIVGIKNTEQNPYMAKRGVKFNIPLDVRTPSYTDMSDAGQKNIEEVWSYDFWRKFIDNLARHRYNVISLWSLNPFPSMVNTPDYPEIALNDVKRSRGKFDEYYSTRATGYDLPAIIQNTETILKISIDEKIAFWKRVMKYGKERNIEFYIMTWNIYTYGINGKYGITDDIGNETTKDYFRKSVKSLFLTYPDLAGIGLTTGENMGKGGEGFEEKENWAFDTYAAGVLDAAKEQPERKIIFIHRQHEAAAKYIEEKFAPLRLMKNIEFLYSFKYAQAHVFSCTRQSRHENFLRDIGNTKTFWTLRNDDNYYFRWGAPEFVREFIKNIPYDASEGFYYGSDQYIWGREFLSREPDSPPQLEIEKHWYHWMLWGRLGYNPDFSNEELIQIIQKRFPEANASQLFSAWQNASLIYPVTTGFHWGALDYKWYIEGCRSRPEPAQTASGFHDVNRFITLTPHEQTGYQSIPDYVKMTVSGKSSDLLSPFSVAEMLHRHADSALDTAGSLNPGNNKELNSTIQDIKSMAYLGKYYAYKITGATKLALYRETKKLKEKIDAQNQLTNALTYWKLYVESAMKQYKNPLWTNRVGNVDWIKLTDEVRMDIEIAKEEN